MFFAEEAAFKRFSDIDKSIIHGKLQASKCILVVSGGIGAFDAKRDRGYLIFNRDNMPSEDSLKKQIWHFFKTQPYMDATCTDD